MRSTPITLLLIYTKVEGLPPQFVMDDIHMIHRRANRNKYL